MFNKVNFNKMNRKDIDNLLDRIEQFRAEKLQDVEELRVKLLGKKGEITRLFEEFRTVGPEMKKEMGKHLNQLKTKAAEKIEALREAFADVLETDSVTDFTKPGDFFELGTRHPISLVREEILDIFGKLGYAVAEGPEIEDDWHVFSALNFPPEHPARDMQDTFFIDPAGHDPILLRTYTSRVQ